MNPMRTHGLFLACACLGGASLIAFQAPPGKVTIAFPADGSYVSGEVTIRAALTPPTLPVQRVSFFADGKLVCAVERPPFECAWDAGPRVDQHGLRVVAQLTDGSRLVHTIKTRGEEYVENVDVDIIQVTASVTDEHGRFVRGLKQDDFRVFENDVPQRIQGFKAENIPLEIVVAVDMSGSMVDAMPQVKRSVKRFLQALRPQDQKTLMAFNDNLVTLAGPTVDAATRIKSVDRLAAWGGTALYDVIATSMENLGKKTGRRALVVFSDGEDQSSHIPLEAAEARVEASDAVIYSIGQGRGTRVPSLKAILERLAKVSGGRAFFTESTDGLDEAFTEIIEELANQYLIGYAPPHPARDGTWRRITVKTTNDRLHVRARQGYKR